MTKGKPAGEENERARKAHTARPVGPGTKITGDPAAGKDKLDKMIDAWKKDIDEATD